ncbi:MAG: EAL domain-containing protein [Lachnospiraceae bacterium]|nr:EAL domain-containing protein [Lachnospiraceae bacterium]
MFSSKTIESASKAQDLPASDPINNGVLQQLQDEFCKVTGLYALAMDAFGGLRTKMSGKASGMEYMQQVLSEQRLKQLFYRVAGDSLEDFVVEEVPGTNVKVAAIAILAGGVKSLIWIMAYVVENMDSEQHFYNSLEMMRHNSIITMENKLSCIGAEAEVFKNRIDEEQIEETKARIEAMTQVVELLDDEAAFDDVLRKVLSVLGTHLSVTSAQLFRINPEKQSMDVVVEWLSAGAISNFDKTQNIPMYNFLQTEKPLVMGSDVIQGHLDETTFRILGIRGVMVFPLEKKGRGDMVLCLCEQDRPRLWQMEEVRFASDVSKILQSIVARRSQKTSLMNSYNSMETVLDNISCCIYVRDLETGQVLFTNRMMKTQFSAELREGTMQVLLDSAMILERRDGAYEVFYEDRGRWYDMMYTRINWVNGRLVELYSLYDITDKKIYQRKIEQQAYTDFLTGLYNRMCCERDMAWHLDDAKKRGVYGGLLYLDLDDFKHINDGLGHQYGDVLLKSISNSLRRIEGIQKTCYRMGGDEFVIVIPAEHYERLDGILEDIRQIFAKPWFLKDADYYCTMSMGIVTFPHGEDTVQDLIKKADIAMYEAKKTGKNRMAKYTDSLESTSGKRLDMEKNMRDATVAGFGEFEVYYQPIMDIQREGTPCAGAEALIRWNSTELGFISPAEFIPLAEYLGLINPIGNHVLKSACETCRYWNEHGYPNYKINVNLSVVQLLQADVVDIVRRTLHETGINPRNLTLEVTESLAINDMERMKEILGSIKALGVRIALDDFGTGYSSLNHIREIPFDVIKVDQSFVRDLAEDAYSQSFIKLVAELAETIGVSICVEGIETQEQYKVLEGMRVRMVQGYYFDRPLTRRQFDAKYIHKDVQNYVEIR